MAAAPLMKSQLSDGKGKHFNGQYVTVYQSFLYGPKTMRQVAKETDIDRANICRYVPALIEEGALTLVKKGCCPITGVSNVGFYQSNPNVKPSSYTSPIQGASMGLKSAYDNKSSPAVKTNPVVPPDKALPRIGRVDYSFNLFNLPPSYE